MLETGLTIFAGNSNLELANEICRYLDLPLGAATVGRFPDNEINVKLDVDVRGTDAFVIQSTCPPVNDHLMELLILIECLVRSSARRVTAVIPYYGYARQDRKDESRTPITAKLVANLLESAGANRVLTMDLHAAQIQGFFDIPVDHLYARPVMTKHFKSLNLDDPVVVSPDVGGIRLARGYSKVLGARLAVVDKRRVSPDSTEIGFVIGDVEGRTAILADDLVSTGGTIAEAAKIVKEKGAKEVYISATHPVFCGNAVERLASVNASGIVVTNSIPISTAKELSGLTQLSVAGLFGEAIRRIHQSKSVSSLFD
ncbi:MAG: ribose-phosphate pyrophosphokinase [Planctomycetota bacterium]|nr:ribose-phosphate pyrophosphokinase [Planctomycetota bacterium]